MYSPRPISRPLFLAPCWSGLLFPRLRFPFCCLSRLPFGLLLEKSAGLSVGPSGPAVVVGVLVSVRSAMAESWRTSNEGDGAVQFVLQCTSVWRRQYRYRKVAQLWGMTEPLSSRDRLCRFLTSKWEAIAHDLGEFCVFPERSRRSGTLGMRPLSLTALFRGSAAGSFTPMLCFFVLRSTYLPLESPAYG